MPAMNQRPELYPGLPVTEGMLVPSDRTLPPLPLKHTDVQVSIIGPICDVRVTQQFQNTHSVPVEALYAFPLPEDAAVTALTMTIGARVIRGEVRERDAARQSYSEAREQGRGAALLEQARPNLFTMAVANIQPGEAVEVALRFHDRVPYDDGAFTFVFPTVVLPRYVPPADQDAPRQEARAATPTFPLTPPLLPEATRDGHTLSLRVELDAGRQVEISSPSHEIASSSTRGTHTITLREADAIPNKDFVLHYRPAKQDEARRPSATAFTYRPAGQPGTLLLLLTPQTEPQPADVMPRELLFVFDRSGSMSGDSIVQARNALKSCLRGLNPGDSFNIFPFDDQVEQFAPAPVPLTQEHVDQADAYIEAISARGGTEILAALKAALRQPRDPERLRVLVFLTDGAVGNEDQVLRELRTALNEARVYAFGIGSAVNRFLLDKLAEVGRGGVEYIFPGQAIEDAVQRFQNRAAFPVLTDLALDWGSARVTDVFPQPLPDLYAGQPLSLLARFHNPQDLQARIRLSGRTPRGRYEQTIELELPAATPDRCADHPDDCAWAALTQLWARARIDALMTRERDEPTQTSQVRDAILGLALEHHLLSPYTSFVAIEELRPEHAGREKAQSVVVPIHLPQGTRREAFEGPGQSGPTGIAYRSMAMPAAPRQTAARARRSTGMLGQLGDAMSGVFGAGRSFMEPQSMDPAPMYQALAQTAAFAEDAAPAAVPARSAQQRYEAALRYLARTQGVSGAWAESATATALVVLAFLAGGHSDRSGNYRPQLTRALRWLIAQSSRAQLEPVVAWALAELAQASGRREHSAARDAALAHARAADSLDQACLKRAQGTAAPLPAETDLPALVAQLSEREAVLLALADAAATSAALAPLQQHGGSADGAVVPPGRAAAHPDATVFAATAAGALAWG